MFSDGMEGYKLCSTCDKHFEHWEGFMKLAPDIVIEAMGPKSLEVDGMNIFETLQERQYDGKSKEDIFAIKRGFCKSMCYMKWAEKNIDKLEHKYNTVNKGYKLCLDEEKVLRTKLINERNIAKTLESARAEASSQLIRISRHPYRYAIKESWKKKVLIKRFFRTNSFAEFVCKYLIVLLIGLVLYETISRI